MLLQLSRVRRETDFNGKSTARSRLHNKVFFTVLRGEILFLQCKTVLSFKLKVFLMRQYRTHLFISLSFIQKSPLHLQHLLITATRSHPVSTVTRRLFLLSHYKTYPNLCIFISNIHWYFRVVSSLHTKINNYSYVCIIVRYVFFSTLLNSTREWDLPAADVNSSYFACAPSGLSACIPSLPCSLPRVPAIIWLHASFAPVCISIKACCASREALQDHVPTRVSMSQCWLYVLRWAWFTINLQYKSVNWFY